MFQLGMAPRSRVDNVPAPIIRMARPPRSRVRSNGTWTWPDITACAPEFSAHADARGTYLDIAPPASPEVLR